MMYVDFAAGGKDYKLRLNTRETIALEKKIGCNPISIFGKGDTIPSVTVMVEVLHASLKQYQHSITFDDAFNIFDSWIEEGNVVTDFIAVIVEIYRVSGIIKVDEKNA